MNQPDQLPIPENPAYVVTKTGIVISNRTANPKVLTYFFDDSGRIIVSINSRPTSVAALVFRVHGIQLDPRTLEPTPPLPTPGDLIDKARKRQKSNPITP